MHPLETWKRFVAGQEWTLRAKQIRAKRCGKLSRKEEGQKKWHSKKKDGLKNHVDQRGWGTRI